jgi:uncharacterized protein (DUF924 family)
MLSRILSQRLLHLKHSYSRYYSIKMSATSHTDVLEFWFKDPKMWYKKDEAFDTEIRTKFMSLYEQASQRRLEVTDVTAATTTSCFITEMA